MKPMKFFLTYEESEEDITLVSRIEEYLEKNNTYDSNSIVIGAWEEPFDCGPNEIVKYMVENKDKFPNLQHINIGDMDSEECEVSWITQTDLAPLLKSFELKSLEIRGSLELRLENASSNTLESLIIVSGGLSQDILKDISNANFPKLEHLELYLGVVDYGFDGNIEDVKQFMIQNKFPNLKYLGLKNSEIEDAICEEILKSDILEQLTILDLSLGTISDKSAELILQNIEKLKHLKTLDVTYNYMSDENIEKLELAFKNLSVESLFDRDDADYDEDDEWRYPYITE